MTHHHLSKYKIFVVNKNLSDNKGFEIIDEMGDVEIKEECIVITSAEHRRAYRWSRLVGFMKVFPDDGVTNPNRNSAYWMLSCGFGSLTVALPQGFKLQTPMNGNKFDATIDQVVYNGKVVGAFKNEYVLSENA